MAKANWNFDFSNGTERVEDMLANWETSSSGEIILPNDEKVNFFTLAPHSSSDRKFGAFKSTSDVGKRFYSSNHEKKFLFYYKNEDQLSQYIFSIESEQPRRLSPTFHKDKAHFEPNWSALKDEIRESNFPRIIRKKLIDRRNEERNIYYSIVHKDSFLDYLEFYDHRPAQNDNTLNRRNRIMIPVEREKLEKVKEETDLPYQRNRLLFGAPGTGKSTKFLKDYNKCIGEKMYGENVEQIIAVLDDEEKRESLQRELMQINQMSEMSRITFYPDYGYSDFVGGYRPFMDGSVPIYKYIPGPFLKMLIKAFANPYQNYLLIIEEINRAQAAAVFGEVFQLLDRRDVNSDVEVLNKYVGDSEYTIEPSEELKQYILEGDFNFLDENENRRDEDEWNEFASHLYIPNNMYIWATMNSADQGVFPLDSAFKRRWNFEFMPIDGSSDEEAPRYLDFKCELAFKNYSANNANYDGIYTIQWNRLRKELNEVLKSMNFEEDRLIGPYFIKPDKGNVITSELLVDKLFSYLRQDLLRHAPSRLFTEECKTMSDIRSIFLETKDISKIIHTSSDRNFKERSIDLNVLLDRVSSEPRIEE